MKKSPKSFSAGDLVFAKVRGYPPWPARIIVASDKNGSKFQVIFLLTVLSIFRTLETKGYLQTYTKHELWFYDAVRRTNDTEAAILMLVVRYSSTKINVSLN
jgi:hypothetical protein